MCVCAPTWVAQAQRAWAHPARGIDEHQSDSFDSFGPWLQRKSRRSFATLRILQSCFPALTPSLLSSHDRFVWRRSYLSSTEIALMALLAEVGCPQALVSAFESLFQGLALHGCPYLLEPKAMPERSRVTKVFHGGFWVAGAANGECGWKQSRKTSLNHLQTESIKPHALSNPTSDVYSTRSSEGASLHMLHKCLSLMLNPVSNCSFVRHPHSNLQSPLANHSPAMVFRFSDTDLCFATCCKHMVNKSY